MHDERHRIEGRVERVHTQRVKPAVYAATVPLTVEAWHAPGEPVPDDRKFSKRPSELQIQLGGLHRVVR